MVYIIVACVATFVAADAPICNTDVIDDLLPECAVRYYEGSVNFLTFQNAQILALYNCQNPDSSKCLLSIENL